MNQLIELYKKLNNKDHNYTGPEFDIDDFEAYMDFNKTISNEARDEFFEFVVSIEEQQEARIKKKAQEMKEHMEFLERQCELPGQECLNDNDKYSG